MRKVREVLRLRFGSGLSGRQVAASLGIGRTTVPITKDQPEGAAAFPFVHTLISNAKMWLGGTFHGGVSPAYLSART